MVRCFVDRIERAAPLVVVALRHLALQVEELAALGHPHEDIDFTPSSRSWSATELSAPPLPAAAFAIRSFLSVFRGSMGWRICGIDRRRRPEDAWSPTDQTAAASHETSPVWYRVCCAFSAIRTRPKRLPGRPGPHYERTWRTNSRPKAA